jgi:drug/metabolite transporter (DMT)-like permease
MRNANGFLFAAAGFALLSCGDAVIKSASADWSVPAIAFLRFLIAIPLLSLLIAAGQGREGFRISRPWLQFARGLALAISSSLFFFSIFFMPIAEAAAISFLSPIFTAILSRIFYGEPIRPSAWIMTAISLIGVALILRPNIAALGPIALLPVGSALVFSVLIMLNRIAVGTGSGFALQWAAALSTAPILALVAWAGDASGLPQFSINMPVVSVVLKCGIVAVSASLAHWLIYQGTVRVTAADAAQAVYVQLPVALIIDGVIFGHLPDWMAVVGAVLIVAAGIGMWQAQRATDDRSGKQIAA